MTGQDEYKRLLTEFIHKQMMILGPKIAVDRAQKIPGMSVSDEGIVLSINGNVRMVLKNLVGEYGILAGQIAQKSLDDLLQRFPGIKI